MLGTAIMAFMTFFATIGPIDVAAIFAIMTQRSTASQRLNMALRGILIATGMLLLFAFVGESILKSLGISLAALRIAGGILLLLIGIDMVFARESGGTSTTREETKEGVAKQDISAFPLATPLIAGPGAIGSVILLMAEAKGDLLTESIVILMLLLVLVITFLTLLIATHIHRWFGVTGMHVVSRILGVLLTALAVQFMIDGIAQSKLI